MALHSLAPSVFLPDRRRYLESNLASLKIETEQELEFKKCLNPLHQGITFIYGFSKENLDKNTLLKKIKK